MALRQTPRQAEREPRLHDGHSMHPHLVTPGHGPPPHLNGGPPVPSTPGSINAALNPGAHAPHHASPQVVPAGVPNGAAVPPSIQKLTSANEQTWLLIGRVAEQMGDLEHALSAYENALRHNPMSLSGLTQVAGIARIKENYPKAVDYFQRVLNLQQDNGEVWSALGHCYLMQDELQKAYAAYQQALYLLPNPKEDPKLWYGIGILYDRYGSLDHAEEAFASVLRMENVPADFDKANEILFRLGIIYKQQSKYEASLECFDRILRNPPNPLAHADIWFQIGHVYEQQKELVRAKEAYERVVEENPSHAKVLQQLGWLYHQDGSSFQNQDSAIQCLTRSLEVDPSDAQSWYLLGRAYMAGQKYNKAYEAYQQAVYRDGRNPTFWCSIGVLYFQINQYRDALDAYSRAIRINPYISEVWFDLGSLYESCNNQISDAIDAYMRAAELDPHNTVISQRLQLLKTAQATGGALPAAPGPQDVHPTAYASAVVPPPGPPLVFQTGGPRPPFRSDSRGPLDLSLPPPAQQGRMSSPGPFRGGPPPPVILDESRANSGHTPLAPMEVDRPPMGRQPTGPMYPPPAREGMSRGPGGHSSVLLHHPVPQQQFQPDDIRGGPPLQHDAYPGRMRRMSTSASPPPPHSARARSPSAPFAPYGGRQPVGPGQMNAASAQHQRSPHAYSYDPTQADRDHAWERRAPPPRRDPWESEQEHRAPRHSGEFGGRHAGGSGMYPSRTASPTQSQRARSPRGRRERSPVSPRSPPPSGGRSTYWDPKHAGAPGGQHGPHSMGRPSPPPAPHEASGRRYDARFDERRDYDERAEARQRDSRSSYAGSPEGLRAMSRGGPPPPTPQHSFPGRSESPAPSSAQMQQGEQKGGRRRAGIPSGPTPTPGGGPGGAQAAKDKDGGDSDVPKKERKKRAPPKRVKEEPPSRMDSAYGPGSGALSQPAQFKGTTYPGDLQQARATPGPGSSGGSTSNRSGHPSPSSTTGPAPPSRVVDEDYDEGVAETLMSLSGGARAGASASPRVHRGSISSTMSHTSPPPSAAGNGGLKRPMSPHPDDVESKRSRVELPQRRSSGASSLDRRTPVPSSRPSPVPFRTQLTSVSPTDTRPPGEGGSILGSNGNGNGNGNGSAGSGAIGAAGGLPTVLPPHPRPLGTGGHGSAALALPPIATLSPTSSAASPAPEDRDDAMQVDRRSPPQHARAPSVSPQNRGNKLADVMHPTSSSSAAAAGSPGAKGARSPPSAASEKAES